MQNHRYAFLDGMRGIAAIFVLIRHSESFFHINCFRSYLAVDLFFLLSGFVIAYAYDEKLTSARISASQFFLIRLIRLYPMFSLSLLLCIVVQGAKYALKPQTGSSGAIEFATSAILTAFFLPSRVSGSVALFPLNGPYWSLLFELLANALYALCHRFLNRMALANIVLIAAVGIITTGWVSDNLDIGFSWGTVSVLAGIARAVFGIFLGIGLYRCRAAWQGRLAGVSPWWAIVGTGLMLASPSAGAFDPVVDLILVLAGIPLLVMVGARPTGEHQLGGQWMLTLGAASYPVYVLHKPIVDLVSHSVNLPNDAVAALAALAFIAAMIYVGALCEKLYDLPVRRWLLLSCSKFLPGRAAARS
jgi:peptidoglycan/LPS O-acetylase OafA/YrhL